LFALAFCELAKTVLQTRNFGFALPNPALQGSLIPGRGKLSGTGSPSKLTPSPSVRRQATLTCSVTFFCGMKRSNSSGSVTACHVESRAPSSEGSRMIAVVENDLRPHEGATARRAPLVGRNSLHDPHRLAPTQRRSVQK
jgi:hypothetical protein